MRGAVFVGSASLAAATAHADRLALLTAARKCALIQRDIAVYLATGHQCGNASAWPRSAGASPGCYLEDATDERTRARRGMIRRSVLGHVPCQSAKEAAT